ncbi:membrane protein [Actinorhabdospora filicis]|uniref:Membrane protein n=1 Tax=Actinorhabdospora filicis TaxID=1785913 RepID=A0A9W6SSY9_9ACTN|nr:DMT family transporter [Actinorhabdospora filicis]GLZ81762.1 membrane protein [Actinorhabdospora filicis]
MSSNPPATGLDRRAVLAISFTVLCWASAFVAIRSAGEHFSPGAMALGRLLAGSVVLLVIALVTRSKWPPKQAWPGIVISGLLWFGGYMVMLNWGEREVDAGTAAMVVNIGPILIALLGGWLLKEGFPSRLMAGMAVSFAGAIIVGVSMSSGGSSSVLGVVLCLLAAVAYAIGVVSQKPALKHASAVQVTTWSCVVGTVATLPFTPNLIDDVQTAPLGATLSVAYLGVFPTALAFITFSYALRRTTAGKLGATTYAAPALVVLMSWLLLGEVPAWLTLVGGVVCLAGVAVARSRPKVPAKVPAGT